MLVLKENKELEKEYLVCLNAILDIGNKDLRDLLSAKSEKESLPNKTEKDENSGKKENSEEKESSKKKAFVITANVIGWLLKKALWDTEVDSLKDVKKMKGKNRNLLFLERMVCLSYEDIAILKAELDNKKTCDQEKWNKESDLLKKILADYLYDALIKGVEKSRVETFCAKEKRTRANVIKHYNSENLLKINNIIINSQEIKTCIYCNGQYIDNRDDRVVAQLDHLFAKSLYPHLAVCIYNLVPSCSNCNMIKVYKNKNFQSPYDEKYNLDFFKFCLDIDETILDKDSKFEVQFKIEEQKYSKTELKDIEDTTPIAANLVEMKIDSFYVNRRDEIQEIIDKKKMQYKEWNKLITSIDEDIDEIYIEEYLYGRILEDDDLKKIPLSKLKRDIMEHLKIIEKRDEGGYKFSKNL